MRAVALSVPVWVVQPSIDLKICMFDCLYQDSIMVQSRWVQKMADSFVVDVNTHTQVLKNLFVCPARLAVRCNL